MAELVRGLLGAGGDTAYAEEAVDEVGVLAGRPCGRWTTPVTTPGTRAPVRIGFNAGFATDHLVSLVRVLRRDHPPPRTCHRQLPPHSRRAHAAAGGDARHRVGRRPVTGAGLAIHAIPSTRLGVLLHDDGPLAGAGSVPVRALADRHLILVESGGAWSIRRLVEDALDRAGVTPSNVTTVSDGMTMLAFVGAGIGLGFGSAGTAALTPRNLTLRPLADGPEIATSLVWKATNDTPALRTVVGIEGELHPLQEAFVARGLQRTVAITPAAGVVLVIVSDQSDQRPHLQPRDTRAQRGRGLQLVDALSRRWDTAACMPGPGKSVWAEITCAEIRAPLGTAAVRTDHATPSRVGSPSPLPDNNGGVRHRI